MKEETKSLYLAIVLSMLAIFGVNYFFPMTPLKTESTLPQEVKQEETLPQADIDVSDAQAETPVQENVPVMDDPRVRIETPTLSGSINLRGARFDDLFLKKYKQTLEPDSSDVRLLSDSQSHHPYFIQLGWLSADQAVDAPNADTLWTARSDTLTPQTPLVLEYAADGLTFVRTISVDENYLFTVQDTVENRGDQTVTLYPYGLISRAVPEVRTASSVVHEGVSALIDGSLKELKLKDLKAGEPETFESGKSWFGFSDRYWFTSLILDDENTHNLKFSQPQDGVFQTDFRGAPVVLGGRATATESVRFFAGAKEIRLLDSYTDNHNIPKFDLAVDFGWYYFLTKPFFYILTFLYGFIGNMGWAILLFAAMLRLLMFPIANKSYESMSKMKKLQPKILSLQEKYKGNQALLQQATMELYRREKINPASGCLPMFIQIPVFFSLYKVLNIAIEIRQAPFVGWIKDLSAPDPLTISAWTHLPVPAFIDVGVWPILMGLTMWIQQKLNPAPTNKDQARMFALMPLIFMFMLGHFASGLVIYWTLSNVLSIIQQKAIMRKNGVQ